jgi:hypothetical protein
MSYLEMALKVRKSAHDEGGDAKAQCEISELGETRSSCGSPDCSGCYEIEPGIHLHPPKVSRGWLEWLVRWEPKGDKA